MAETLVDFDIAGEMLNSGEVGLIVVIQNTRGGSGYVFMDYAYCFFTCVYSKMDSAFVLCAKSSTIVTRCVYMVAGTETYSRLARLTK